MKEETKGEGRINLKDSKAQIEHISLMQEIMKIH
jgi:hypothetical protein